MRWGRGAGRWGVMLVGLALVSCGGDKYPGKIHLRYMAWGNPEQMALEEGLCDRFNAQNPDLHVTFLRVPGSSYLNKAIVMLASRTAADVLRIDHYNFPSLVKKRYFLDMTPYAKKDPGWKESDFFPLAIEEGRHRGGFYGPNVMFGGLILYYNKTRVKESGLEDPYTLYKQGRWTWDVFREYAIRMTKRDSSGKVTCFGTTVPAFPMWLPQLWAYGGDVLTTDYRKSRLDEPVAAKVLQSVVDLRYVDKCAPTPAQSANSAYTFESGKLAMEISYMGNSPRYRKVVKSFEWDVVPLPSGPHGGASALKGNQLVAPKDAKHPEASWRLMRFLTGPEVERVLYVQNRRNFPTRKAVAYSDEFLNSTLPPFQNRVFQLAVEQGKPMPIHDRWFEWTQAMNSELDGLMSGRERSAAEACKRAAAAVNKVLADEAGF